MVNDFLAFVPLILLAFACGLALGSHLGYSRKESEIKDINKRTLDEFYKYQTDPYECLHPSIFKSPPPFDKIWNCPACGHQNFFDQFKKQRDERLAVARGNCSCDGEDCPCSRGEVPYHERATFEIGTPEHPLLYEPEAESDVPHEHQYFADVNTGLYICRCGSTSNDDRVGGYA